MALRGLAAQSASDGVAWIGGRVRGVGSLASRGRAHEPSVAGWADLGFALRSRQSLASFELNGPDHTGSDRAESQQ